ncbi:MAG TPA: DUF1778 domain-containing protein [Terriglobales bacterium]|nr:DUF1778 domain-containing protein [Terriglobales bacterium]
MTNDGKQSRTALLIRCTEDEAAAIREAASRERRTVSAFVLNAVMNRIKFQQRMTPAANLRANPKSDFKL